MKNANTYIPKDIPLNMELTMENHHENGLAILKRFLSRNQIEYKIWDKLKYDRLYISGKGIKKTSKVYLKITEKWTEFMIQVVSESYTGEEDKKSKKFLINLLSNIFDENKTFILY